MLDILNIDSPEWMADPNRPCKTGNPDDWYDTAADLGSINDRKPHDWAKRLCAGCPLATKQACLEHGIENEPHFGVWGGTTANERLKLRGGANAA